MPVNMSNEEKDPVFVMNSFADQQRQANHDRYLSTESLDDHHSTTSSTESNPNHSGSGRKDHEFIPTRMKTISASKPAADPTQFTRIPSNPLLISAQKQLMKVEEVKKKKEVVHKRGDDEPDWQNNLSSWKDRRRKQSEEALMRVAEVKALESGGDEPGRAHKLSIGKKLSSLLKNDDDEDWSDLGLEKIPTTASEMMGDQENDHEEISQAPKPPVVANNSIHKKRTSLPASIKENPELVVKAATEEAPEVKPDPTDFVKYASKIPGGGGNDGYGEGVPVLNRKTSAPVMPYGSSSPRISIEEKEAPPIRRKSSELSSSMKSRLEAFTSSSSLANADQKRVVEPDNTFREKLQTFRKISEPQPEDNTPKGPKPPLSYKTLIGNSFSSQTAVRDHVGNDNDDQDNVEDDVDQLLDDALEESYRSVLETENLSSADNSLISSAIPEDSPRKNGPNSTKLPPTEKPPPPPTEPVSASVVRNHDIDRQEQEIIASLEKEEREHKKYMDTVNAMRNLSPTSTTGSESNTSGAGSGKIVGQPQPFGKKSMSPTFRNVSPALSGSSDTRPQAPIIAKKKSSSAIPSANGEPLTGQPVRSSYNQHWLVQEAEQRRISEQQMRQYQQQQQQQQIQSPVYENSNYIGGVQQMQHVPPPSQYTNHQRPVPNANGMSGVGQQQPPPPSRHHQAPQQPSPNENMYANLGQHPPLPPNFQRDIPPGPPPQSSNMRGLPGPQVPPRNAPGSDGNSSSAGGSADRLLSVSGKKKCSHCKDELGRGAAMIIESLRLFYHLRCFKCVVCHVQLGNGSTGTDVRVRNNKLHCQNCYSNDEGLKFSKV